MWSVTQLSIVVLESFLGTSFVFTSIPLHFPPSTGQNCNSGTMFIFPGVVRGSDTEKKYQSQDKQINPFKYKAILDIQIKLWCAQVVPKQYCLNTDFKLLEFWCYLEDSGYSNDNNPRDLKKAQLSQSALATGSDKYLTSTPRSIINHFSKRY